MADTGKAVDEVPVLVLTLIVGATVLVIFYISKLLKSQKTEDQQKNQETIQQTKEKSSDSTSVPQKPKKKHVEKWSRDSKQAFSHPWLLTSLKGHSARVLDVDFSSNGKYLATCAEEDSEELDPGGSEQSSGSEGNKDNSQDDGGSGDTEDGGRCSGTLSRRQKRNRIRRDDNSPVSHSKKSKHKTKKNNIGESKNKRHVPLRQHTKLNLNDSDLSVILRHYVLSPDQLLALGYPVESALYPGKAIIYKNPATSAPQQSNQSKDALRSSSHFDVNAREFIPKGTQFAEINMEQHNFLNYNGYGEIPSQIMHPMSYAMIDGTASSFWGVDYADVSCEWMADHGLINGEGTLYDDEGETNLDFQYNEIEGDQSSPEVSVESEECELGDVTTLDDDDDSTGMTDICTENNNSNLFTTGENFIINQGSASDEKKCVRCGMGFFVTRDGEYLTQEKCLYHWGKLRKVVTKSSVRMEFACCRGRKSTRGCTTGKLHVWYGSSTGINGPYDGYVKTKVKKTAPSDGNFGIYAIDCEMCFTTQGLELTKVTVVGADGHLVYDCLVQPENYIIDYNTRFSGITARDLSKATKTLKDVQNDLMGFINADTILIGHGLENDLRALKIIHGTVIDTSVVFPHYYGLPYRRSLKSLVGCYLKRDIQQDSSGHDSFEDARACIELMLWKIRKDFRTILEN